MNIDLKVMKKIRHSMSIAVAIDEVTSTETADGQSMERVLRMYEQAIENSIEQMKGIQNTKGNSFSALKSDVMRIIERAEEIKEKMAIKKEEEHQRRIREEEALTKHQEDIKQLNGLLKQKNVEIQGLRNDNADFYSPDGCDGTLLRQLSDSSQVVYSKLVEGNVENSSGSLNVEGIRKRCILHALYAVEAAHKEGRISIEEKRLLHGQMLEPLRMDRANEQNDPTNITPFNYDVYDDNVLKKLSRGQERCLRKELTTRVGHHFQCQQSPQEEHVDTRLAPPDIFQCPITFDLMRDPVIAADGHSYERSAIEGNAHAYFLSLSPYKPLTIESI